jgi:hypothetical protein
MERIKLQQFTNIARQPIFMAGELFLGEKFGTKTNEIRGRQNRLFCLFL